MSSIKIKNSLWLSVLTCQSQYILAKSRFSNLCRLQDIEIFANLFWSYYTPILRGLNFKCPDLITLLFKAGLAFFQLQTLFEFKNCQNYSRHSVFCRSVYTSFLTFWASILFYNLRLLPIYHIGLFYVGHPRYCQILNLVLSALSFLRFDRFYR